MSQPFGVPSSECSPRRNRAPLSRPLAPLQSSTNVPIGRLKDLVAAGFIDSHAFTQSPDSSQQLWTPFSHSRKNASRSSWIQSTEPYCSASFVCFGALFLLQVRSHRHELPHADGRSSLEFSPLQGFLHPHPGLSNPPRPLGSEHAFHPKDPGTTQGISQPLTPGETVQGNRSTLKRPRRRIPIPFEIDPHRLSTASLLPWP